jgi:hypothetical protein
MRLTKRLERLEARIRAQDHEDEFYMCREVVYDPLEWDIDKDEAISRMMADELDRLVAAGEIRECDRGRVTFIVEEIVRPSRPEQLG